MKKLMSVIAVLCLLLIFVDFVAIIMNPMRWSQENVRSYALELTPLGTSMEDVIAVVKREKRWAIDRIIYEKGYIYPPGKPDISIMSEKSIKVHAGTYRSFTMYIYTVSTIVTIYWGFDEDGNLIDIYVQKDTHM